MKVPYGRSKVEEYYQSLFRDYYPSLTVFAIRYVEFQQVAEDIVQDVFVKMWENREKLDQIGNLSAYLYQTVRFRCLNHLRAEKIRQHITGDEEELTQYEDDGMDAYIAENSIRILMRAVDTLPPACREIMMLVLQGYTAKEISELLGIAVETVKKQKQNARRILRTKISVPVRQ